jgi:uncharacterized protein (DUF58 family)
MALPHNNAFDPARIAAVRSLQLRARIIVEGTLRGMHRSPYHGFSSEFREYRPYMTGESVRAIDWKKYAKTDRAMTRRYEDETNLQAHVLLDKSGSMAFSSSGRLTKFDYARTLAAAIAYLLVHQRDAVGLYLFDTVPRLHIPPRSTNVHLNILLNHLEHGSAQGGTGSGQSLNNIAARLTRRGMCVILSDLLDDPAALVRGLRHLRFKKQDIIVLQILDPREREASFADAAALHDMETGRRMAIDPDMAGEWFSSALAAHTAHVANACIDMGATFATVTTTHAFHRVLLDVAAKRQRLY